jgi:flagellar assembly factor FliW
MHIHTVNFGDLTIPDEKVIEFKEGLPGFPRVHRFTILEFEDLKPFQYLQALDDPPIALFVINPFLIDPAYRFQISTTDMEDVFATRTEDLVIYAVATIPEDPQRATINLMAPIVINDDRRCGKQVILHESDYSVRHPLFNGSRNNGVEGAGA